MLRSFDWCTPKSYVTQLYAARKLFEVVRIKCLSMAGHVSNLMNGHVKLMEP